jgi:hypothetical protein
MALQDQNLVLSSAQAVTASAVSTNCYDILNGALIATSGGTYTVPPNSIIGNATYFGEDLGLGRGVGTPAIEVFTGSGTPAAATSLQVALQGAPDNGGGTISGLTFVTYIETRAIPLASILASIRLCAFDFPRREVGQGLPRFIQLDYIVVGSNFTGLTLTGYINLGGTSAQATLGQYPSNY